MQAGADLFAEIGDSLPGTIPHTSEEMGNSSACEAQFVRRMNACTSFEEVNRISRFSVCLQLEFMCAFANAIEFNSAVLLSL